MLEEIRQKQIERIRKRNKRKKRVIILLIGILLILGAALYFLNMQINQTFEITTYNLDTDKIDGEYKIALLSDLHNSEFGENNGELIQAVEQANPDIIVMCGDMVLQDDPDVSVVLNLCEQLKETADIYYILGNHEGVLIYQEGGLEVPLDGYLYDMGVTVCYPGEYVIQDGENKISLFSASMNEDTYKADTVLQSEFQNFAQEDCFKIVASHFPNTIYDLLANEDFDLGVAGHFHGGQVIVPGIGGLYHKDTGFFPEYYGGMYDLEKAKLVVTRGLGNSSVVPRINNKPELVLIDING